MPVSPVAADPGVTDSSSSKEALMAATQKPYVRSPEGHSRHATFHLTSILHPLRLSTINIESMLETYETLTRVITNGLISVFLDLHNYS